MFGGFDGFGSIFDGWDATTTSIVISAGALLVAAGALEISRRALHISALEHREFLVRLRARACFDLTLDFDPAGHATRDGEIPVMVVGDLSATVRVRLGIKNDGDRAAGATAINFVVPEWANELRWCGPEGQELDEGTSHVLWTDEELPTPGQPVPSRFLEREVTRVARRPNYVRHATFTCSLSSAGERWVPVKFTAQADEIPDDVKEYVAQRTLRVLHSLHPEARAILDAGSASAPS